MKYNIWERFDNDINQSVLDAKVFLDCDCAIRLESLAPLIVDGVPVLSCRFRYANDDPIDCQSLLWFPESIEKTRAAIREAIDLINALLSAKITFTTMSAFAEIINSVPIGGLYDAIVEHDQTEPSKNFSKVYIGGKTRLCCEAKCGDHMFTCRHYWDRHFWLKCPHHYLNKVIAKHFDDPELTV